MRRSGTVAALLVASLLAAQGMALGQYERDPVVTAAVQVTADPSVVRAHTSPQLARNPVTGELVIVEGDIRGSRACAVHLSVDDGRSWAPGGEPLRPPYTDCSYHAEWGPYATMDFDDDGVLYMAIEASDPALFEQGRNNIPRHIFLARSPDSGRTFETFTVFEAPGDDPTVDINKGATVAVDPAEPNHVYIGWRQGSFGGPGKLRTMVAASSDGGRTWGEPVDVSAEAGGDFPWMTVTPDGVLHVVTWTRVFPSPEAGEPNPVRPLFHVSSSDNGATFTTQHEIDPGNRQHEHPPVIASDPNSGVLYVTWAAQPDADNHVEGYSEDTDVYFRSSVDGGETWSAKQMLNDDQATVTQIEPSISVAPNGRIDVAWYDGRLSPAEHTPRTEEGFNDIYATYSVDGGETWAPNIRVSDRSADRSIGVWDNNIGQKMNVGIASSDSAMYVAWQDTRNADPEFQPEDVYFATVQIDGPQVVELSGGDDGVPSWLLVGAGVALGAGAVMILVFALGGLPTRGSGSAAAQRSGAR